ncbi:MAG: PAS domain-containing protein [Betaproteobacteria bacterium]|nr:MAG: PAS domain-containing protein [Betaproteobacteria bacterium]
MQAPLRYPELFLAPPERTPESFWISLAYFNLYRVALATLFLTLSFVYGDALALGSHALTLFRYTCVVYLAIAVLFHVPLRKGRELFNVQLSLHACVDILAITLLMYASGGMRSGLGVMLVVSLIAAAIVAPRRLSFLYAAIATIALLMEQAYWVLGHDAAVSSFVQPGLLAMGCFAATGVTGWLAGRVASNERLASERGRALATQMRVNELVQRDMHDGVLVLDREGQIVQHNPQAQRLLRAERLVGGNIEELLPQFASRWRTWRGDGAALASADLALRDREIRLRLLDAGTPEAHSVLFVEDMTRARDQAQQLKLAALGRLTANIAHEIRNPLAAISHASELLEEEKRAQARARLTRIIKDNTKRLDRLVSDVLQLNRRDRMSAAPIRVHPWLREFLAEFVANEAAAAERFAVDVAADAWIEFDREHLRQVMWNLLGNAARYAGPQSGAVRIALRGYGGRVELSVIDNGPGVPAARQAQLFEPFFTTEAKGTGLGLYLARELCAANRATLEYVDDGPGAHFRILCREARAA